MDHIGDYIPKVGEKFIYLGQKDAPDLNLDINRHSGKVMEITRVREGNMPYGVSNFWREDGVGPYYLNPWELAFIKPTVSDLGEWM